MRMQLGRPPDPAPAVLLAIALRLGVCFLHEPPCSPSFTLALRETVVPAAESPLASFAWPGRSRLQIPDSVYVVCHLICGAEIRARRSASAQIVSI